MKVRYSIPNTNNVNHLFDNLLIMSSLLVAKQRAFTNEMRVLAYMARYCDEHGDFRTGKYKQSYMLEAIGITRKQYRIAIDILIDLKLLTRIQNADSDRFCYYRVHNDLKKMSTCMGDFELSYLFKAKAVDFA